MPPATNEDLEKFLATSPLLDLLPKKELTQLASHARRLHFDVGETVFAKDEPDTRVYWVMKGRLKLTVISPEGHELLHSMIEVGGYCGEISAVDGERRGVNAIADRVTDTVTIERQHLLPSIERNPKVAMKLARLLCGQIRVAGATLENLAFHSAEMRIWTRLKFLSEEYGETDSRTGALEIRHRLSQQSLADSVGLTRVMVNRQLGVWRDHGLTEDGRGFIRFLDQKALEAYVWRKPAGD